MKRKKEKVKKGSRVQRSPRLMLKPTSLPRVMGGAVRLDGSNETFVLLYCTFASSGVESLRRFRFWSNANIWWHFLSWLWRVVVAPLVLTEALLGCVYCLVDYEGRFSVCPMVKVVQSGSWILNHFSCHHRITNLFGVEVLRPWVDFDGIETVGTNRFFSLTRFFNVFGCYVLCHIVVAPLNCSGNGSPNVALYPVLSSFSRSPTVEAS